MSVRFIWRATWNRHKLVQTVMSVLRWRWVAMEHSGRWTRKKHLFQRLSRPKFGDKGPTLKLAPLECSKKRMVTSTALHLFSGWIGLGLRRYLDVPDEGKVCPAAPVGTLNGRLIKGPRWPDAGHPHSLAPLHFGSATIRFTSEVVQMSRYFSCSRQRCQGPNWSGRQSASNWAAWLPADCIWPPHWRAVPFFPFFFFLSQLFWRCPLMCTDDGHRFCSAVVWTTHVHAVCHSKTLSIISQ